MLLFEQMVSSQVVEEELTRDAVKECIVSLTTLNFDNSLKLQSTGMSLMRIDVSECYIQ